MKKLLLFLAFALAINFISCNDMNSSQSTTCSSDDMNSSQSTTCSSDDMNNPQSTTSSSDDMNNPQSTACEPNFSVPIICYEVDCIEIFAKITEKENKIESEAELESILLILNDSNWDPGCLKITHDFVFSFEGSEQKLHYFSPYGVFNDWENERTLTLSDEQREMINSILNSMFDESDFGEP